MESALIQVLYNFMLQYYVSTCPVIIFVLMLKMLNNYADVTDSTEEIVCSEYDVIIGGI